MDLAGVYPIVPTPFFEDGSLDFESMDRLIAFLAQRKVNGIAVLGALGEGHKLMDHEKTAVIRHYRKQMPSSMQLVAGVRAPATDPAVHLAKTAQELGADAILLGPHGVQKDPALLGYYLAVDQAVDIPILIHDYPAVTGIFMSVDLIADMFKQGKNIQYVKLEDPPTGPKMRALEKAAATLKVFGALGGLYALEELESGAVGIMTGFVFSGLLVKLVELARAGQWERAADLFYDFVPLVRWEFQPGWGVSMRKKVLQRLGIFTCAKVRHPGPEADEKSHRPVLAHGRSGWRPGGMNCRVAFWPLTGC